MGYTLSATAPDLTGVTSAAFAITPGAAAQLVFTVQPGVAEAGTIIVPAVQVTAQDAHGNTAADFAGNVTVALAPNAAGGTVSGVTTVGAIAGVATFASLTVDIAASGYTLLATTTGLTGATSAPFTITVGTATRLAFTVQPSSATAGVTIAPQVEVSAWDAQGNLVPNFAGSVTVAIGSNPGGGTLSGTMTVFAVGGVAAFPNLSIDKAGSGYTLSTSASALSGATSADFDITPGTATHLSFTVQPSTTTAGAIISPAVRVTGRDALGNTAPSFAGNVTVAIGANPAGGDPLGGTRTFAAIAGVATFANLHVDSVGIGYTLTAVASGLVGATSAPFDMLPSTAAQL
ncbi:MAG: S8 family serine peptidase, partial [Acidimicrobiales bacterium]